MWRHFFQRHQVKNQRQAIYLGLAVAVVFLVVGYLVMNSFIKALVPNLAVSPVAYKPAPPTPYEYQVAAHAAMGPFLAALDARSGQPIPAGDADLLNMIDQAQKGLLSQRLPAEYQEGHLQAILLLDQWRRALQGTEQDRLDARKKTDSFKSSYPWFQRGPSS